MNRYNLTCDDLFFREQMNRGITCDEWALQHQSRSDADELLLVDPAYEEWGREYDAVTAKLRQEEDMNINDVYQGSSDFLKAADLKGKGVKLVISKVDMQEFDEKGDSGPYKAKKLILSFEGTEKQMVCNKTNGRSLGAVFGDETDTWIGKEIKLFTAQVDYQGTQVPAIRVQVEMAEESFDDDIPF